MYGKCNPAEDRTAYQHTGPFIHHHRGSRGHWGMGYRRPKYNVPVNIAETGSSYKVYVYAVGFEKEKIKLSVAEGILYVSGTREVDEATIPNFIRQEFPVKVFERTILLNDEVDSTGITAKQQDGVLIITLPKTEEAQRPAQEIKVD